MKTIETRVIDTLKPHPRNAALYGNELGGYDDKLVASLKGGIWPGEIQVTTGNVIISGHRRCDHAIFAEIKEAEVWVRRDLPEDPNAPEVLEALLQGNLQRNKTREQQLREFELWLVVEKELRKGRNQHTDSAAAENLPQQKVRSRDAAAERVGLGSGYEAEKALKALKAADTAEATGDAEQIEKAKLVKQELAKSLGGAVRVAREQGLIAAPKPKKAKTELSAPAPEPAPQVVDAPAPAPRDPSLPLPELSNKLIASEKKAAAKRTAALANLAELNADMEKLWKAAQRHFVKEGRSVLRNHQGLADQKMVADGVLKSQCEAIGISGDSSYFELLRAIDAAGKKLSQSARQAIYLFGYTSTLEP